jgi:hypothetical protein
MTQAPPRDHLSPEELSRLQDLETGLAELHHQREPLANRLAEKFAADKLREVVRLNREIARLNEEREALLGKNLLLGKNQPGYQE